MPAGVVIVGGGVGGAAGGGTPICPLPRFFQLFRPGVPNVGFLGRICLESGANRGIEGWMMRTMLYMHNKKPPELGGLVQVDNYLSDRATRWHLVPHLPQPVEPDGELPDVQNEVDCACEEEHCAKTIA